ncbi:PleD family two-component system response regulator [Rhodospirillaceae bacterium KN72]|uniref:diguanylate cyclase n=1 Tax=Pacificispira spongiicola TaxID=2729598 RepID=A0A7Y0DZ48_9PROT|nr:PleD family two-component system response regulator [Pacificispira spongiicola]NMM44246.1 PleD family two-component system response regulator [Pacificispira spongiicola]
MTARVLVVDDLLPNVKLLEAKLTSEYFEVITARDGMTGLEMAKHDQPDIILLDVMMPGMDGFEVCERLKRDPDTMHIPVIMVTALSDSSDRVRGLEAGADDFLTKPVNDAALFARVRSLVRLKMLMDEWRMREQTSGQLGVMRENRSILNVDATHAHALVVEDSPVDAQKIVDSLDRDADTADIATSVDEAHERLAFTQYELVIINLRLAAGDALRLCSHIRAAESTRHTPLLLTVEEDDTNRLTKALDIGINDYLIKPIDKQELLARVRTQIRRQRYQEKLRENYERSLAMALTDSLTGLYNRRYLNAHLAGLVDRVRAGGKPLAVMMFDIDFFKKINDTYGHAAGDEVLVELSRRIGQNVRSIDTIARHGGEEFVVLMPDADYAVAGVVAERLRKSIVSVPMAVRGGPEKGLNVSISIGVAMFDFDIDSVESVLHKADQALYFAKHHGRNCSAGYIENEKFEQIGGSPVSDPGQDAAE